MAAVRAEAVAVVSTHSRLKAAGEQSKQKAREEKGFNTQPPEGGWEIP